MTTTISIDWYTTDGRRVKRDDPAWYTDQFGNGHSPVVRLSLNDREVIVSADGAMRASVLERGDDGNYNEVGVIRFADDLGNWGIYSDEDLELPIVEDGNALDFWNIVTGPTRSGHFIMWENNSWFDLYANTPNGLRHMDLIDMSLTGAIDTAEILLADDGLWSELMLGDE